MSPGGAPVQLGVDLAHGGRWTSLSCGGREWLWSRDAPERPLVRPGSPFVDAGGMEECIPTVRGAPDHGDVWGRPWTGNADEASVTTPDFALTRSISRPADGVVVDYSLRAAPGYRFVWAAHLLLDVDEGAVLECAPVPVRVFEQGETWVRREWPDAGGWRLDLLGPDDGTAVSAIVETDRVTVRDRGLALRLSIDAPGQPAAIGLWRNLRGWPAEGPYRSIGVEPMLGLVWDRSAAAPGESAVAGPDGTAAWRMVISPGPDK